MKYSKRDFEFLRTSWTFRNLHGKTARRNSETDLYNLICNGSYSVFGNLENQKLNYAANKIPYILTLLLDELFNVDVELQKEMYIQETDRQKAWIKWNNMTLQDKLKLLPWLDTYFDNEKIIQLFNSSKRSENNTDVQNELNITELLEFIGGLYNIFEASPNNYAPVPVTGPSRTNLKSREHIGEGPYSNSFSEYTKTTRRVDRKKNENYQYASLDSINEDLTEIWTNYNNGKYKFALNPIRIVSEDLIKRALLEEKAIFPSNAKKMPFASCIKLFEENTTFESNIDKQVILNNLDLLKSLGNDGSHPGLNSSEISKTAMDNLLNAFSNVMEFLANKYEGDFRRIYELNSRLGKTTVASPKDYNDKLKAIEKTVSTLIHDILKEFKKGSKQINSASFYKNLKSKWLVSLLLFVLVLFAVVKGLNTYNQSNSYDNDASSSHVVHKRKPKPHHKKVKAEAAKASSSSKESKVSSKAQSSQSSSKPKPKVSKWVGIYKGIANSGFDEHDDGTLQINQDGSVVYKLESDDNGVGKATGYWVNGGSISSKIYLTHFSNLDKDFKNFMPLIITMSSDKQKIFIKSHSNGWRTDQYTRWENRQHYDLTDSKWVGTFAGETSNYKTKVKIKIKSDGSVSYIEDGDDGVGKATGYWINGKNEIHLYFTHLDNIETIHKSSIPLIVTMSSDQDEISVNSKTSGWTTDHYERK